MDYQWRTIKPYRCKSFTNSYLHNHGFCQWLFLLKHKWSKTVKSSDCLALNVLIIINTYRAFETPICLTVILACRAGISLPGTQLSEVLHDEVKLQSINKAPQWSSKETQKRGTLKVERHTPSLRNIVDGYYTHTTLQLVFRCYELHQCNKIVPYAKDMVEHIQGI